MSALLRRLRRRAGGGRVHRGLRRSPSTFFFPTCTEQFILSSSTVRFTPDPTWWRDFSHLILVFLCGFKNKYLIERITFWIWLILGGTFVAIPMFFVMTWSPPSRRNAMRVAARTGQVISFQTRAVLVAGLNARVAQMVRLGRLMMLLILTVTAAPRTFRTLIIGAWDK